MTEITSRQNQLVLETVKLRDKKYRDCSRSFAFEGMKLLGEALNSEIVPEHVFVTERAIEAYGDMLAKLPSDSLVKVTDEVYDKLSVEKSPEGILCTAKYIDKLHFWNKIYVMPNETKRRFLLVSIRDPGNLGTCIRSATAFGIDELILSADCADIYNSKCVRAAMGALFRQHITVTPSPDCDISEMRATGIRVYAAALSKNAEMLSKEKLVQPVCFAVGNEGHGLPSELVSMCDGSVIIPMEPGTESLNASVAASLLMWECYKTR